MVYTTSIQLGIKWRILGIVFCFIPIINTCILLKILLIIKESGCEKVNIIAHSKGGLDARMAIINPKIANSVASLKC